MVFFLLASRTTLTQTTATELSAKPELPWRSLRAVALTDSALKTRSARGGQENILLDDHGEWLIYRGNSLGGAVNTKSGKQVFLSLVRAYDNTRNSSAVVGFLNDALSPAGHSYGLLPRPFIPLRGESAFDFWLHPMTSSGVDIYFMLRRQEKETGLQKHLALPKGEYLRCFDQDSDRIVTRAIPASGRKNFSLFELRTTPILRRQWKPSANLPESLSTPPRNGYSSRLKRLLAFGDRRWFLLDASGETLRGNPLPPIDGDGSGYCEMVGSQGGILAFRERASDLPGERFSRLWLLPSNGKSWIDLGPRWLIATSGNGKYGVVASEYGAKTAEVVEFK